MSDITDEQQRRLESSLADIFDTQIVSRWVVIAECMEEDGEMYVATHATPGMPFWTAYGMSTAAVATYSPQPGWTRSCTCDDDEDLLG